MIVFTIGARFRGPTSSGNGGYVAGHLAGNANAPVSVILRATPPLDRPLTTVATTDGGIELWDQETLIATVRHAPDTALTWVPPCSLEQATAAEARYGGSVHHPFPQCFVCGTERGEDGLNLRPGPIDDGVTACTWTVAEDVAGRPEFVWAALDCPGAWAAPTDEVRMLLGTMTAQVDATPEPGERCVVMGRLVGSKGRKYFTETSAYGEDERRIGRATSVWIAVPNVPGS